ncbi:MAG: class I SAM-dependent methyltransferase [Thermoleophilaceae bacterium]
MDARETWASGNYAVVAETITDVAESLVERTGVEPGMELLDVATGTGNVALPAAQAGARVTGLDLVPELLDVARERGADLGLELDWVVGDAERLPFEDDSFDRVLSVFGAMFAPDHRRTADELLRVCRPGGAIGMCNWTPDGTGGELLRTVASYVGAPPEPPAQWGTEEHFQELLGGRASEVELGRRFVEFREESADSWVDFMEESFGPFVSARATLGERWPELRSELVRLFEQANESSNGKLAFKQEYLLAVVRL